MKFRPYSRCFGLCVMLIAAIVLLPTVGRAQQNPIPNQTWNNAQGDNLWVSGGAYDAENNATGFDWTGGATPNAWGGSFTDIGYDDAIFSGHSGTITVDDTDGQYGPVLVDTMYFLNGSGNFTFTGGAISENPFTSIYYQNLAQPGNENFIVMNAGAGNVTYDNNIVFSDEGPNQQSFAVNNSNSTLTFNNLDFGAYTDNPAATAGRRFNLSAGANATITLNGAITTSAGHGGQINFTGGAGTYNITSSADFSAFNAANPLTFTGAALNIQNSTFTSAQTISFTTAFNPDVVNIQGAQTINLNIYNSTKNSGTAAQKASDGVNVRGEYTINQSTANTSTWAGQMNLDGSNITLSAVAGGRLNYTGTLYGDMPQGLIKTGAGTVVLYGSGLNAKGQIVNGNSGIAGSGNTFDERDGNGNLQTTSTIAGDIRQGTLLITNTSGSAFGIASNGSSVYGNPGSHSLPVLVENGATLGGSGISTQLIQSMAAGAILAPGDSGSDGGTKSISTLHLTGGVSAASGLTMDFKLASTPAGTSDRLDLGAGAFTLSGVVTVNLTAFDGPLTAGTYTLATGTGNWSDAGATFVFTAPVGDSVTYSFIEGANDSFNVTLAVPEPSTYALIGLALLVLIGSGKLRKLNV